MTRHLHLPLKAPEDIIPHLARQGDHWKPGYSAMELAISWCAAADIPVPVRRVLNSCPDYEGAELVDGFFERAVDLRTPGRHSQTDLMLILALGNELAVAAVEGKTEESFGPLVAEWNDGSAGKVRRLAGLCQTLGLDAAAVKELRYQLLHRTCSAIYEAQRYRCRMALMLVHSFSRRHSWFTDFGDFAAAIGIPVSQPNEVSAAFKFEGIELRLGWVADLPAPSAAFTGSATQ